MSNEWDVVRARTRSFGLGGYRYEESSGISLARYSLLIAHCSLLSRKTVWRSAAE